MANDISYKKELSFYDYILIIINRKKFITLTKNPILRYPTMKDEINPKISGQNTTDWVNNE